MAKATSKARVKAEDFVKAVWESDKESQGIAGIVQRTGLTPGNVNARLYNLRKKNVKLPNFRVGGNNKTDVASLNAIAQTFQTVGD